MLSWFCSNTIGSQVAIKTYWDLNLDQNECEIFHKVEDADHFHLYMSEKTKDDEETFERKFKLSSNTLIEKIASKFDVNEEDSQILIINIPKDVKIFQVPIVVNQ